jgi:hypothetical protein
MKELKFHP